MADNRRVTLFGKTYLWRRNADGWSLQRVDDEWLHWHVRHA